MVDAVLQGKEHPVVVAEHMMNCSSGAKHAIEMARSGPDKQPQDDLRETDECKAVDPLQKHPILRPLNFNFKVALTVRT